MGLSGFVKLAGVAMLALGLSACVDAEVDITLLSATTAKASLTQVMTPDLMAMMLLNDASADETSSFCANGTLLRDDAGGGTCVITEEGRFAALTLDTHGPIANFSPAGPGLVRIEVPTTAIRTELEAYEGLSETDRQMARSLFNRHTLTLRFAGAAVLDTNLDLAADGTSAEKVISFVDLLTGSTKLPDSYYAVVQAP